MTRARTKVNEDAVQMRRLGLNGTVVEETKKIEGSRIGEGGYSDLSQLSVRCNKFDRLISVIRGTRGLALVGIYQDAIFASAGIAHHRRHWRMVPSGQQHDAGSGVR